MAAARRDIDVVRLGLEIPAGREDDFTDELVAGFIEAHPVKDSAGRRPADLGWAATYDLNAAVADLWSLIAANLSALYDFTADGASFTRSQAYEHARKMQRHFQGKAHATSAPVTREREADILYQGHWPYTGEADLQAYKDAEADVFPSGTTQGEPL
jgi:hypothetical protein